MNSSLKPNIILLITHDTGRHLSPYGVSTVDTPHCERLARESTLFEQSFCTAPQCSPSRASIVTGRYPHANGVMGLTHEDFAWAMHDSERPIAMLLREAGYVTWLLGWQHEAPDPHSLGFDHVAGFPFKDLPKHLDPMLRNRPADRPFYCQLGSGEVHRPFTTQNTVPDDRLGVSIPSYLKDGPQTREEIRLLQGVIKRFDHGLGQLLALIDQYHLTNDTLLIVTTDHGLAFPRAKGSLYDPGIETMLFLRWPGRIEAGARKSELVSNVDILPTILECAGATPPDCLHGRSLMPLLDGGSFVERDAIFAEKTFHDCYDPMRCIRTKTHKYIRYFEKSSLHCVPGDVLGGGASRELGPLPRHGVEELYALESDPAETTNLAGEPACRELLQRLRARLYQWMRDTGDPLLQGPVASPFYYRSIAELTQYACFPTDPNATSLSGSGRTSRATT